MQDFDEHFKRLNSISSIQLSQLANKEALLLAHAECAHALSILSHLYLAGSDLSIIYHQIILALEQVMPQCRIDIVLFNEQAIMLPCSNRQDINPESLLDYRELPETSQKLLRYAHRKRTLLKFDTDELFNILDKLQDNTELLPKAWFFLPFEADSLLGGISLEIPNGQDFTLSVKKLNELIIIAIHVGNILNIHFQQLERYTEFFCQNQSPEYVNKKPNVPTPSNLNELLNHEIDSINNTEELKQKLIIAYNEIKKLTEYNLGLQKDANVKTALFELSQLYTFEGDEQQLFKIIFKIIRSLINIDNFYIAFLDKEQVSIPFFVDTQDNFEPHKLHQANNPDLGNGLTHYALINNKSITLDESEIRKLEDNGTFNVVGKIPKQWCFMPFRTTRLIGGISVQSYHNTKEFSVEDISMLSFISMHIGNLLSLRFARQKIQEQYETLKKTQVQLVQSEKMASIGQLAAGVAHEINNPLGYVNSNIGSLKNYINDVFTYLDALESFIQKFDGISDSERLKEVDQLQKQKEELEIEFVREDIDELLKESSFGMEKVRDIVQSLKDFSRVDQEEDAQESNINDCIEQTLKIVWNELKYKCEVIKNLGEIPDIYCFPGQLNQVIMNLLVNAGHAIEEKGTIEITTFQEKDDIYIKVRDTGKGIPPENIKHLFEPFFTTKPVGQGTGLGLSISYGIVKKHQGEISVSSEVGIGTEFTIKLPINALKPSANK
jgi:signal transduction histidine kinase